MEYLEESQTGRKFPRAPTLNEAFRLSRHKDFRRGYNDFLMGLGISHDGLPEWNQRLYESGREWAQELKIGKRRPRIWPDDQWRVPAALKRLMQEDYAMTKDANHE